MLLALALPDYLSLHNAIVGSTLHSAIVGSTAKGGGKRKRRPYATRSYLCWKRSEGWPSTNIPCSHHRCTHPVILWPTHKKHYYHVHHLLPSLLYSAIPRSSAKRGWKEKKVTTYHQISPVLEEKGWPFHHTYLEPCSRHRCKTPYNSSSSAPPPCPSPPYTIATQWHRRIHCKKG